MSSVPPLATLTVPGYRDLTPLFRSERTQVHSAIRIDGNARVALKSVSPGTEDANARWRLHHEHQILSGLDIPHVVKAYGLKHTALGITLELEHVGSGNLHALTGEVVALPRFLDIATRLAAAVAALHDHDISHRDINPSNVMYHRASGDLWLIDFGLATSLQRERTEARPTGKLEGTLGYLSPEQTGRMNRSVDRRTDFYSLGATLYQLLAGRPPFAIRDPLALLHATIALRPTHPSDLRDDVPRAVGDIVMKLLEKDAEQRYQSGRALVDDLQRAQQLWQTKGEIPAFALGTTDRRGTFLIPEKLYGREEALVALEAALQRSLGGGRAIVGLPGRAGVGKTALTRELQPRLPGSGLLATGVCNPIQRSPYAPILQVYRTITATVLAGPAADLDEHRQRYEDAVDGHGALLALLMPELETIVGPQVPVTDIPPSEARERVLRMLVRLLRAYHSDEHPLVLFLDDLQWADPGTLDVLDRLLAQDGERMPLVILAWREDEVGPSHPLTALLEREGDALDRIALGPLSVDDVTALLADALTLPADEVGVLAERVHAKTAGNAFFVRQFLNTLVAEKLLFFDGEHERWSWSLDAIEARPPSANVADLLSRRLEALSDSARSAMGAAACVGKRFDLGTLAEISDMAPDALAAGLTEALRSGMLQSRGDAWTELQGWARTLDPSEQSRPLTGEYWFVHDAVHDAALALPTSEQAERYHLETGRLLLERWRSGAIDPFAVADQLNQALGSLGSREEALGVAEVNLDAGERAYGSAAFPTALYYLERGVSLVSDADWKQRYDLAFQLHLLAARSQLMVPEHRSEQDFAAVAIEHARDAIDRVAVRRVQIRYHTGRYEFSETIRLTLEALQSVGVTLPARPHRGHVAWALLRTHLRVFGMTLPRLRALPVNEDKRIEAAMNLLMDAAAPSYYISSNLMPLILCKMVDLSVQHGVSRTSAFGMAGFGFVQIAVRDQVERATMWATYAQELVARFDDRAIAPKVDVLTRGMVEVRTHPLGSLIQPFLESAWTAKEVGDAEYTALCHFNRSFLTMLSGVPLAEAANRARADLAVCEELAQSQSSNGIRIICQLIECLRGDAPDPAVLSGSFMDRDQMTAALEASGDLAGAHSIAMRQAFLSLLFADTATTIAQVERAADTLDRSPGSAEIGAFRLHAALAWCQQMRESGTAGGRPWRQANAHLRVLRRWARDGPANAAHKARLVEAELADLRGQMTQAIRAYDEAIRLARGSGMLHEEAICLEWAARASYRYGHFRNAAALLREAQTAWLTWGCRPRLQALSVLEDQLQQRGHGPVVAPPQSLSITAHSISTANTQTLDVASVVKASRAVSSEIELGSLLRRLMEVILENAGATYGFLVLHRGGSERVVAWARTSGAGVEVTVLDPEEQRRPAEFHPSAAAVVTYVTRSRDALVLHDVEADPRFFRDQQGPRSILCAPALKGRQLVGVMYLENDLARHAFTEDRHEIVSVLCSQAAVSIENALLYRDLRGSLDKQTALTVAYGRFMPPQFLDLLDRDSILDLELGDQVLRPITVMFADIRNFTGLAEAIGPERTFAFINRYLGHMEPAIHAHDGFVNQYLGDGIMALFPGSADDAVGAALAMVDGLRTLNEELAHEGKPAVSIGIGLNSGPLMVGAIGGLERMGRGVVGDPTNVAARLEGLTKVYRVPLLLGESVRGALTRTDLTLRLVDRVLPKGREHTLNVYEVLESQGLAAEHAKRSTLAEYERAVALWEEGAWLAAEASFRACVTANPDDTPALLFAERCREQSDAPRR